MGIKETCHCGHDKASHYEDHDVKPAARGACLAMACECRRYTYEGDPKPVPTPRVRRVKSWTSRPHADPKCNCAACRKYDGKDDEEPTTDPYPYGYP